MKAVPMNEEQGGFGGEMTGMKRIGQDWTSHNSFYADFALDRLWDYLQTVWNNMMNPGAGGYIEGGSEGHPVPMGNGGSTSSSSFQDLEKEVKEALSSRTEEGRNKALDLILNYGPIAGIYNNLKNGKHISKLGHAWTNDYKNSQDWSIDEEDKDKSVVVRFTFSISNFMDVLDDPENWKVSDLVQDIYIELYAADLGLGHTSLTVNAMEPGGEKHTTERYLEAYYTVFHDGVNDVYTAGGGINGYFKTKLEKLCISVSKSHYLQSIPRVKEQYDWGLKLLGY